MSHLSRSRRISALPLAWLCGCAALVGLLSVAAAGAQQHKDERAAATAASVTPEQAAFFEKSVRPLLAENCLGCHNEQVQQGSVRLDARAFLLKPTPGGVPIVAPGDPDGSSLVRVVRHVGKVQMPPGAKLKETRSPRSPRGSRWARRGRAATQPAAPAISIRRLMAANGGRSGP
jgi:hypothetical protein